MDRGEPTLAPEWLKAAGSSSHSDEHNTGSLLRIRLAASACDHDAPRSSSSSFRRSASTNGSMGNDKDSYAQSRAYSSFGRSHRDRDRDRERDRHRDREKDNLLDNGYSDYADSLMRRRTEKDTLRRSHSMVSGRRVESFPKRSGSDSSNGVLSVGSLSGGLSKVSFERDFPSLGAEEKQGVSDVGRVSSHGISTAINSLPISSSAIIGTDGWTSALAEVPAVGVGNGPSMSSALQTTSMSSTASSTTTGLSMAETLAQAPSRARTATPLSNENERRKELTLMQQYNKLIPVLNSSEKSKTKGARNGDPVAPKVVQQPSSQMVNHALRLPATKPDILKTSQAGNFLVLNREKNATSPTAKDGPPLTMASRVAISHVAVPSASSPHLKSPANLKLKANGVGVEKKPLFQAQDRNNFFNSLRKQAEMKNGHPELSCSAPSSSSVSSSVIKSDDQIMGVSAASACQENKILVTSDSVLESSVAENGYCNSACDEDPETLVAPDEEEKAFLESLGWNENAGEGALTAEEIESFVKKHEEKLGPDFKYKAGLPESWRSGPSEVSHMQHEEKLGPDFKYNAGLQESRRNGPSHMQHEEKLGPDFKYNAGLPESRRNGPSEVSHMQHEEKLEPDFKYEAGLPESRRSGPSEVEVSHMQHEEKLGPDFKYEAGLPESRRSGPSEVFHMQHEEKLGPDFKCKAGLPESRQSEPSLLIAEKS